MNADIEQVREALRAGYVNGYCVECGKADPDDDGHRDDCVYAAAFAALARVEARLREAEEALRTLSERMERNNWLTKAERRMLDALRDAAPDLVAAPTPCGASVEGNDTGSGAA